MRHYGSDVGAAWMDCFVQEKVPYINAIVREAGRYYTVSAMSLPRKTVTEVNWNGAIIPPKTMILINAQAGNHGNQDNLCNLFFSFFAFKSVTSSFRS